MGCRQAALEEHKDPTTLRVGGRQAREDLEEHQDPVKLDERCSATDPASLAWKGKGALAGLRLGLQRPVAEGVVCGKGQGHLGFLAVT